ncbi:MAG: PmoA family protein [Verrucomicrobia bacterium]|nr:PmoA family protein [Verrucomicrobiota bacterium]
MIRRTLLLATLLGVAAALLPGLSNALAAAEGVKLGQSDDRIRVEINGELFTEYVFKGAPHVYYYPLIGPGGLRMTRDYPMVPDSKNEDHDHPHHRSLWYSHGAVNGVDFWSETAKAGKILHDKFLEVKSGQDEGVIRSANKWVALDGKIVCTDERTFRIYARPNSERLFDFEITVKAPADSEVVLGDTKEGTMSCRVAETMRVVLPKKLKGEGHIVQSTGVLDGKTWGQRAEWCDYYGPVQGKTAGIAIFDHPSNPVHPTYWHVRDYGLFGANPFGIHDFTNKKEPAGAGNITIAPGKSVTFKYRFYIHEGDEKQAKVAERYAEWTKK